MELTYIIGVNGVSLALRNELKRVLECGDLQRSKINLRTTEIKDQSEIDRDQRSIGERQRSKIKD